MTAEAIAYYHSLLTDEVAAETYGQMETMLRNRKLFFGDRPLCTVLRPHFYTPQQFEYLKRETEVVLRAFKKAHDVCMANPELRKQFFLEQWEEEMMQLHPASQIPWSTSRLDSFFSLEHDSLAFIEYNAETPAGMAYEDTLASMFLDLPLFHKFQERFSTRPLAVRGHLLDALLQTYTQWLGSRGPVKPQIAIADWDDVPTRNEHRLCKEWFEQHGVPTILCDPREMEYRSGKLHVGDFRVDLIYKRVLGQELFQRMGSNNAIFQALRDGAVCISNSFQALLLYKKSSLAFLSDEANSHLFSEEENRGIAEHIPWTRVVSNRKTHYKNSTIDLVQFISENRERLVLKPNDAYGGKGVVLGWVTSQEDWNAAIQTSLDQPSVVQEKVHVASEVFPSVANGKLEMHRLYVDSDPFIFMGTTVHGCLTRLSSAALLNVTAGHGSAIPTFLIDKR